MKTTKSNTKKPPTKPAMDDRKLSKLIQEGSRSTPDDRAYEITDFVVNHIWGGEGYRAQDPPGGNYRAKLSLFKNGTLIAELYFYDQTQGLYANPVAAPKFPPKGGHHVLYFPMNTLPAIQQQLYQPNGQRLVTYYDSAWCIETTGTVPSPLFVPASVQ